MKRLSLSETYTLFLGENMIFTEEMLKKYARPLSAT